ncbi:MAG TPA: C40 family peptidase, partial [Burkholderiaceae bacterium]|nr:C40 family peptidase [Burkholderiaceae bacterium]
LACAVKADESGYGDPTGRTAEHLRTQVRDTRAEIVAHALGFLGVPYVYGGTSPREGFDCSGLVVYLFEKVASLALPRTAAEIRRRGRAVSRKELAIGDLVFFNTRGWAYSHVGIYLGHGRFVHAPNERGFVRIERFDISYWQTRFNGARRIPLEVSALELEEADSEPWLARGASEHGAHEPLGSPG